MIGYGKIGTIALGAGGKGEHKVVASGCRACSRDEGTQETGWFVRGGATGRRPGTGGAVMQHGAHEMTGSFKCTALRERIDTQFALFLFLDDAKHELGGLAAGDGAGGATACSRRLRGTAGG